MFLNKVILIGRLTRDPELRYTPANGVAVANFRIAVDRPFTNQQGERETDFIDIVVWRKQAEACSNYLTKGSLVAVEGRLQVRSYDDREGIRRRIAEVVAENVRFLEKISQQKDDEFMGDEIEVHEDDIPF
ncbi:MAG: single-stranded DNA-binding protein [Dethiobacteria bacterium]|jgi:single-strand DNA-binding protein|nr:single-stranded DNA-binding protein [Bacillota bacterium]